MTGRTNRAMALAVLAAMVAACSLCVSAHAEQAVGLEAQGVDPWSALHNPQGLDVRDAEGHPVSAEVIRRQLTPAHSKMVAQAAEVSRLPKAGVVFKLIDLVGALGGAWRNAVRLPALQETFALPLKIRRAERAPVPAGAAPLAALAIAVCCCRAQLQSRSSLQKSSVLRC